MSIVPQNRAARLQFYEAHFAPWTGNAVAIGLTPESVTALGTLTDSCRTAYDNMIAARQASKAATLAFYNTADAMHADPGAGADMIATIKNYAQITDDPNVYVLAEIPAPAVPGVVPPPGRPFDFEVGLGASGAITLGWKCDNPTASTGVYYEVRRQIGDPGDSVIIGTSGERSFTDDTLPASAATAVGGVVYTITAVRGALRGGDATVLLKFGTSTGSGALGVSIASPAEGGSGVKLAA